PVYSGSNSVASTPEAPARYRVRSGDSLWRIANRHQISVAEIARWNDLNPDAVIKPGQTLLLQADSSLAQISEGDQQQENRSYVVRSGDALSGIARRFGVTADDIASWNGIQVGDLIHPGQRLQLSPGGIELN